MRITLLIVLVWSCFGSYALTQEEVYQSLKKGNWEALTHQITEWAEGQHLYASKDLHWSQKDVNELVNSYAEVGLRIPLIEVAQFADKKNVWDYWSFWSGALTEQNWQPKTFFKNKKEALALARYNVLILLSHEFGHHLADRYKVEPENLNCKEYGADKISHGFEQWLSLDERFKIVQLRYAQLLADINNQIATNNKFEMKSYAQLEADCACIQVVYPTDKQLMKQYASAFFVRRIALYEAGNTFNLAQYIQRNHQVKLLDWESKFPSRLARCVGTDTFLDRFSMAKTASFNHGVKLMLAWGEGSNKGIAVHSFAFDSLGTLYNVQMNLNSVLTPGDLWDFRFYDTTGNLTSVWETVPPLLDSIESASIVSVFINDVHNNLGLIVGLKNSGGVNSYYLLSPSSDELSLEWHWLGSKNGNGLSILSIHKDEDHNTLKLAADVRSTSGPMKDGQRMVNVLWESLPMLLMKNELESVCLEAGDLYVGSNFRILSLSAGGAYTVVGNGLEGNRCDNTISEISYVRALRCIGNQIYSLHYMGNVGVERGRYVVRVHQVN